MSLLKVSDRVWYLPHDEETDRPLLGYIRGDRRALMIDAGNSPAVASLFLTELDKNCLPRPDLVLLTHAHWDHSFGLCGLSAVSIASRRTQAALRKMSEWVFTDEAMRRRLADGDEMAKSDAYIRKAYKNLADIRVKTVDIAFKNRLSLNLGGLNCEMMRLDNSHDAGSVIALVKEEKLVFLGDICCENLYLPTPAYDHELLLSLIRDLEALDFEWALEGHSGLQRREELLRDLREAL